MKRSPDRPLLSLDARDAEGRYRFEPADDLTPEALFERKWALTVLDRASARLRDEWSEGERSRRFEALRIYLTGDGAGPSYRDAGEALGMSEEAVKVSVHRLRRRFGELLRAEVGDTVREPSDVDDEIRELLRALRI
jgi:RNA polymerase sigma-70 factor (ECF subfamily)